MSEPVEQFVPPLPPAPHVPAQPAPKEHASVKSKAAALEKKYADKATNEYTSFFNRVRYATPAFVINNGLLFNSILKGSADLMSIWSALRPGSQSYPRLVASSVTLSTEILGLFYKEKDIPDEKRLEYQLMSTPQYLKTKTLEAFHPKDHIFETVGLSTAVNGVFTTFSGLQQSSPGRRSWETFQGLLTIVAGGVMTFMENREKAWQISMVAFWTRAPVALKQSADAYYKGNPDKHIKKGDWQQFAKWVLNQFANGFGFLYGGVKKLPDGSIIHIGKKGEEVTPPYHPPVRHHHGHEVADEGIEKGASVAGPAHQISEAQLVERVAVAQPVPVHQGHGG